MVLTGFGLVAAILKNKSRLGYSGKYGWWLVRQRWLAFFYAQQCNDSIQTMVLSRLMLLMSNILTATQD